MNEAQALAQLASILNKAQFVEGDRGSIDDMVTRYAYPPFTRAYPICIRLSRTEYAQITALMKEINQHFASLETSNKAIKDYQSSKEVLDAVKQADWVMHGVFEGQNIDDT